MRSFVKIKPSQIGEIILSFTDIGKSRSCRDFLTSQICVLTLFAKIVFSESFLFNIDLWRYHSQTQCHVLKTDRQTDGQMTAILHTGR